jgi:hypothetical protein
MTTTTEQQAIVSAQIAAREKQELERLAADADRTLSAEIRRVLRRHLADIRSTTTHPGRTRQLAGERWVEEPAGRALLWGASRLRGARAHVVADRLRRRHHHRPRSEDRGVGRDDPAAARPRRRAPRSPRTTGEQELRPDSTRRARLPNRQRQSIASSQRPPSRPDTRLRPPA